MNITKDVELPVKPHECQRCGVEFEYNCNDLGVTFNVGETQLYIICPKCKLNIIVGKSRLMRKDVLDDGTGDIERIKNEMFFPDYVGG